MRVTNGIPLGRPLHLTGTTVNSVQTLKGEPLFETELANLTITLMQTAAEMNARVRVQDLTLIDRSGGGKLYPHIVSSGTVRVFRQKFTLEDAIGSHACSLEASRRVTNGIPLGCPRFLPVHTVNCVQTLKARVMCWALLLIRSQHRVMG
jgi:hypothetical protein